MALCGGVGVTGLEAAMRACVRCPTLVPTRTQVVVGQTPPGARLVVLGEAPGAREDELGEPFVGRSGQLLDRLLAEAGMARPQVAVLNTVKCRPPGNRTPSRLETERCRPWLESQLAQVAPQLVVTLGLSATGWFLGRVRLGDVRGQVHEVGGHRVLPTFHPAAALRGGPNGEPMRLLAEDLRTAAGWTA